MLPAQPAATSETRSSDIDQRRIFGPSRPLVCLAFGLGWNLSELYQLSGLPTAPPPRASSGADPPDRLPELADFDAWGRARLLLAQITSAATSCGVGQREASMNLSELAKRADPRIEVRGEALRLHFGFMERLVAEDPRAQRSYRLGVALAHTVLDTRKPLVRPYREVLQRYRVATMCEWLDSLKSSFPPYAAEAVKHSLIGWRDWAADDHAPAAADAKATESLRRQGEVWRSLLAGEILARDVLTPGDYAKAASKMLAQLMKLVGGFVRSWTGAGTLVLVAVVLAGGIWLLSSGGNNTGRLLGGAVAVLAAAGITAGSAGSTLRRTLGTVQQPLWDAVLGDAISTATYVNPRQSMRERGFIVPEAQSRKLGDPSSQDPADPTTPAMTFPDVQDEGTLPDAPF
jgi:hypothetical protein